MTSSTKILDRVRGLLAKAESTTFTEEADALTAKAQELIAKYSIDAALLAHTSKRNAPPVNVEVHIEAPYADEKFSLLSRVARANDCSAVWNGFYQVATVIGHEHDLEAVDLLFTSLLVQATSTMLAHGPQSDPFGRSRTRSFRRSFLLAFASRIGVRLHEARATVEAETIADQGPSASLVLVSKREVVEAAVNEQFPNLQTMRYSMSNSHGFKAGWRAGGSATLGASARLQAG